MKHTIFDLHRSRAGHKTLQHRLVQLRPPRIAMLLAGAAAALHYLLPYSGLPSWPLAAVLTGSAGFVIMMRAWWLFREAGTPICPTDYATSLITGDIFAITRNPMYLGIVLMLLALALFAGSAAYYGAALLYFLVMNAVFCPFEERRLGESFTDYEDYFARVPRWL